MQARPYPTPMCALAAVCFSFLSALVILPGCTTSQGTYISPSEVAAIRTGRKTKAQVVALIGYPIRQTTDSQGRTKFVYAHVKSTPAPLSYGDAPIVGTAGEEVQTTVITFSPQGVVSNVEYETTSDVRHGRFGRGGYHSDQAISPLETRGIGSLSRIPSSDRHRYSERSWAAIPGSETGTKLSESGDHETIICGSFIDSPRRIYPSKQTQIRP